MEKPHKLDLVIFGASGFTGVQLVRFIKEVLMQESWEKVTWGVSGRCEKKLREVLAEVSDETGDEAVLNTPVIIADVFDVSSLQRLTSQAKVVINCTGPYQLYGEPLVKACVEQSCHYVDVAAESLFCEKMQLNYSTAAQAKGIYIISSCAFDSIPVDVGVEFLRKNFAGTLNSVETYHDVYPKKGFQGGGPVINEGTWQSLVYHLENFGELQKIRKKLFVKELPNVKPELNLKVLPHQCQDMFTGWVAPFPGTDADVVHRSQRYFYEETKTRPIQIQSYLVFPHFWQVPLVIIGALICFVLSRFKFGADLLRKHSSYFTFGIISPNPSKEQMDKTDYTIWLRGRGWKGKTVDASYNKPTNAEIIGRVKGRDGYKMTAVASIISALILIFEKENLPKNSGVLTPTAAFGRTSLIKRLHRNGVEFEICSGDLKKVDDGKKM